MSTESYKLRRLRVDRFNSFDKYNILKQKFIKFIVFDGIQLLVGQYFMNFRDLNSNSLEVNRIR